MIRKTERDKIKGNLEDEYGEGIKKEKRKKPKFRHKRRYEDGLLTIEIMQRWLN